MSNEMMNKQKIFLPKNYQIFFDELKKSNVDDIFNLNDNSEFVKLVDSFLDRYHINEIDSMESLMIKVISGDQSDNIISVWSTNKNGRKLGIGEKGAKSICEKYIEEFGEMDLLDPDLYENIADIVCEKKKLSKSMILKIKENIENNMSLINLDIEKMPIEVKKRMENEFQKL
jgi:5'-3' exonuclease